MTRNEARDYLISLGVTEPTDEQVTNILNTIGAETRKATDRANAYKAQADEAKELQRQLDEIQNANLSEIERANKATEQANNKVAELEKQMKAMQLKADLATNGVTGDVADNLIKSIEGGSFDASILGQLLADREKLAIANYEKERLAQTPNPVGNSGENQNEQDPIDIANAKTLVFGTAVSSEQADFYKL